MAQCYECGGELPNRARFCPQCGAAQRQGRQSPEQLYLPEFGFGLPHLQPAGAGAPVTAPAQGQAAGRPLSVKQVAVAVVLVLLFMMGIIFYAGRPPGGGGQASLPTLGAVGEPIQVGNTIVGVAFISSPERINDQPPANGRYLAVGLIIGNQGRQAIQLNGNSFGLTDHEHGGSHHPVMVGYGTPEELNAGVYQEHYRLSPEEAVAGVLIFDIAQNESAPHLLVRDLTAGERDYTGTIDLTRQVEQQLDRQRQRPDHGFRPL